MKNSNLSDERLAFWNSRAYLDLAAGSGDINLKMLEIRAISKHIGSKGKVLDAGCGNSRTLAALSKQFQGIQFFGFDYSPEMINESKMYIRAQDLHNRISVCEGSLLDKSSELSGKLGVKDNPFDCVYTERSIINLDSFDQQAKSIEMLWSLVCPGGRLILCEAFNDGLEEINFYRKSADLHPISSPWHNLYLNINELSGIVLNNSEKFEIIEFSGSYYFASRVLNARMSQDMGCEPAYDTSINLCSMNLASLPVCGQSKLVIFHKL